MASNSVPLAVDEPSEQALSHDDWWTLFDKLRLAQQPAYAEVGGPVAFLRHERDADTIRCLFHLLRSSKPSSETGQQ